MEVKRFPCSLSFIFQKEEQKQSEASEEEIAETAKLLTETVIENATTPSPTVA